MRQIARFLILFLALAAVAYAADVYVCPMAEHAQQFDKPGRCPVCGMQLVKQNGRFRVAVLVFNHAEDIDFTAPIEVFGQSGAQVFTVAATADPINTVFGLHIRPDYDLAHAPAADLILVPGGAVKNAYENPQVLSWLRERAAASRYVMSVCNGAFTLAKAGLLDGLTATTTAGAIESLAKVAPKTHVVRERYVDNGRIITTAGLSAGIDGALHVIELVHGRTRAEQIARGIEYRWDPESKWTRSRMADMRMPDIRLPDDATWETLASRGDTETWEMSGRLKVAMSADAFLDFATKQIESNGWTLHESGGGKRTFARVDESGRTWVATLETVPDAQEGLHETMSIHVIASR